MVQGIIVVIGIGWVKNDAQAIAARLQPDEDAYRATIKVLQSAQQMVGDSVM